MAANPITMTDKQLLCALLQTVRDIAGFFLASHRYGWYSSDGGMTQVETPCRPDILRAFQEDEQG